MAGALPMTKPKRQGDPRALKEAVQKAVVRMRGAEDGAADLRDEFYATVRKAVKQGVKLEELASVTGLTPQRVWQIAQEEA